MLYVPLLIFIALPCSAVNLDKSNGLSSGPLARYIELYGRINDDHSSAVSLNLAELKNILSEMSMIEHVEMYRLGLKQQNELRQYFIANYQYLVDESIEKGFIVNSNDSITDILLQTFDYDSNVCTGIYFDFLKEINETFEHTGFAEALRENSEIQLRNCWERLMDSLSATSNLLGTRYIETLNEVTAHANKDSQNIVIPPTLTESRRSHHESIRIAKTIAEVLTDYGTNNELINYGLQFRNHIERPCRLLIDKSKQIMLDVYGILKYTGLAEDFIGEDEVKNVNRYLLCERILADLGVISVIVAGTHDRSDVDLITQLLPNNPNSQDQRYFTRHLSPMKAKRQPNLKRKRNESTLDKLMSVSEPIDPNAKRVIKVEHGIGRGKNIRYPTIWSDGSVTSETKDYLVEHWFKPWFEHYSKRKNSNYRRYMSKSRAEGKIPPSKRRKQTDNQLDQLDPNLSSTFPRVTRIEKAVEVGPDIKYITHWSDNSTTFEDKQYLVMNWTDRWVEFVRIEEAAKLALNLNKNNDLF